MPRLQQHLKQWDDPKTAHIADNLFGLDQCSCSSYIPSTQISSIHLPALRVNAWHLMCHDRDRLRGRSSPSIKTMSGHVRLHRLQVDACVCRVSQLQPRPPLEMGKLLPKTPVRFLIFSTFVHSQCLCLMAVQCLVPTQINVIFPQRLHLELVFCGWPTYYPEWVRGYRTTSCPSPVLRHQMGRHAYIWFLCILLLLCQACD